jgi:hypothetical protein
MAASRAVRISLDWSARSLSARLWWLSSVEPRGMILHATCSVPSSFLANLTLPILPAPMVLPRIHLPDWVGMEVREDLCLAPVARASAAACMTGGMAAGPALLATAVGPAISGLRWLDRVLLRRWTADFEWEELRLGRWATSVVS